MDNDSIGAALRVVRDLEVTEEDLSVDVIKDCCLDGPGHFLAHSQTLERMERDFYYPKMDDRVSPMEWEEKHKETTLQRAEEYVDQTLSTHFPSYIPEEVDCQIRARFTVHLPMEKMRP